MKGQGSNAYQRGGARMSEAEENHLMLLEAIGRLEVNADRPGTPLEDVMAELGITDSDLEAVGDVKLV